MKNALLTFAMLASSALASAQSGKTFFTPAQQQSGIATFNNRAALPGKTLFNLNMQGLKAALANAPLRGSGTSKLVISFPDADGVMQRYRIIEAPVMEAELAARYPEIKSYAGQGVDDPMATIRFSVSPLGLQTMTMAADKSAVFIEPYATDLSTYSVYKRADKTIPFSKFDCQVMDHASKSINGSPSTLRPNADDSTLRTYRLAMSVTGEYTAYYGGTKALALAAINATMTRVNGVFEKDFGVHMNLIANNDAVIYTSASTDPYGSTDANYNSQLQSTLTSVIGNANYDIGHLMSAIGNNGNAGCIGCVCASGKGSGFTTSTAPLGDNFDIDFVAHEMGHQFGANHTFTFSNEGTGVQNEPGSGTTIMGYAGITGATDVQPHSDPFFHAVSIQQVTNYVKSTSCQTNTPTGNAVPTANAGSDYTIPKGTPFMLTASGTDANADALTYCWEQMNSGTSTTTYPSVTATSGPAFRSFVPSTSGVRYFPRLATIKTGATSWQWEAVPNVARTLNFRVTVRDNHAGGPANNSDDMVVTVNATAGPFVVTAPNTATSWAVGSAQTVTWNVAGTTANGVNTANVDILLSTDGGDTYPITLLSGTPNDGSQAITVPNNPGTLNRIMVKGSNHIFFDISNTNFTITTSTGDPTPPSTPLNLVASGTTQTTTNLSWSASTDNVGVTGYDVFQGGVFKANVTGTTYTVTGLSASTAYSFYVRAKDAAGNASGNSNTVNVTTLAGTGGSAYCASKGNSVADEYISKVQLGTINNTSTGGTGYSDFTSISTNLTKGTAYTITVTPTWTGSAYPEGYAVWIDYNADGDFSDTGELVWSKAAATTTPATGTFTPPTTVITGTTRMRVSMKYNGIPTACEAFSYGEVEDYTVNLTTGSGGGTTPTAYCASKGNSVADEYISKVQFGTINNTSTGGTGYSDFTSVSTSVNKGSAYTITVTPTWTGSTYAEGYAVWIDYNADGDFSDSGELVWSKAASTATPATGSVTIPATATTGSTRMRVSMKYNAVPTACEAFSYGEVEDYTIVIAGTGKGGQSVQAIADIKLYPNPTEDMLNITNITNQATYRIINIYGQVTSQGKLTEGTVNVANLASGTYLIEINDNGTLSTLKFIKK
ncbi:T9SS type A sorting domain-containing protein [Flavobacterium zepuense]|uniref:T9SS type A sorting domain-containing protein n=1 Tax=Flavobacterium zepuense TaxID=2593302 RepID=A0A552UW24_9FLAO|nr:GEVED domain-containing protein [Flavobacterium zepuense]TRW22407.1 T9SS type A sorting domain-containing protein [Flavobacterium zepuense]